MTAGVCMACAANGGELSAPGGVILDDGLWRVEHQLMPAQMAGWLIVKPLRHVESLAALTGPEAAALGPLLQRVTWALERAMGPERVYAILLAEAVRHVHFHLVPRGSGIATNLRGPAIFECTEWPSEAECARIAGRVCELLSDLRP